ncbi:MAG: DotU family type IV/VI secretion system protein [Desulfobacterales bacterium]|nr:DotU family type IV/VI secretion system protein [Desulfobacterales bacterium]
MRLTDCFIDIIAYVAYFNQRRGSQQLAYEQVQADILRLLSASQDLMTRENLDVEDYDQARFAVIAWVDDTIMNSRWSEKGRWQQEQLQRRFYQMADAGEVFFDRLNKLGPHQRDVREVYYLCLAMGFKGQYCHAGDDFLLDQLKSSNLKMLIGTSIGTPSIQKAELFPEAYPADADEGASYKIGRRIPALTLLGIGFPVVLFLGLFLIYNFILNHLTSNLLSSVPQ